MNRLCEPIGSPNGGLFLMLLFAKPNFRIFFLKIRAAKLCRTKFAHLFAKNALQNLRCGPELKDHLLQTPPYKVLIYVTAAVT